MNKRIVTASLLLAGFLLFPLAPSGSAQDYEIGGPLAGMKLPLFQGQHGEKPGFPGCVPELIGQGKTVTDMGSTYREWDSQGQAPEMELYPGSVEHWRAYWFKYCPVRSFFDRQSQLRNFVAPGIPGATTSEEYAAPVYWVPRHAPVRDTGKRLAPVPVIRMKVSHPVLKLDLGELAEGLYAVRVIGAVPTPELRPFRKPIFLRMRVNDTPGKPDAVTTYKRRIGYCDEFYSVCEFYFHAPEKRTYAAELWMDAGSETDLLVHNISVDDVLAGTDRRAIKKAPRQPGVKPAAAPSRYSAEDRLARDEAIWRYLPPVNHQGTGHPWRQASFTAIFPDGVELGAGDRSKAAVEKEHGAWSGPAGLIKKNVFTDQKDLWDLWLVHARDSLAYTRDDLAAYKPLPDPFPFKDDGTGLYYPDPQDPGKGRVFADIGIEVMNRIRFLPDLIQAGRDAWRSKGDSDAARDAAVALASYAYLFPTIESATYLCNLTRDPAAYGRNMYNRRREAEAMFLSHYATYLAMPTAYDGLFDYIQGNEELARSVGRFIPWVKTADDLIKLIDVYLVQITAKRILRYQYHTNPNAIAELAALLGPGETIKPWIDWYFTRTHIYPLPLGGIHDLMISGNDREGAQYIGSTYYAQGEGASGTAETVDQFKGSGILPSQYDLTDSRLYPKPLAKCHWQIDITIGGLDFPRIGDVGGPEKKPGATLPGISGASVNGWKWSGDPRFAWVLKHRNLRAGFSSNEWTRIEKAAATVPRAPWLSLKSRQVYNWFGALEAGTDFDDPNLRRSAYLRTGAGIGHEHHDALDLQYFILGLPMTIDGGQRPGYTTPGDRSRLVHNVVDVDGSSRLQSWVSALADGEGARYLRATAAPPDGCSLYQRSIALLDVDGPPATSYIVDVFRVGGGNRHTYSFHGPIADAITTTAIGMKPVPPVKPGETPTPDQIALQSFKDVPVRTGVAATQHFANARMAGTAPRVLQTTWRYSREPGPGNEQQMLGKAFDPQAPRRYTRLHLLDVEGARVCRGDAFCYKWNYKYTPQLLTRTAPEGQSLESAFLAVHEPYTGEPFILKTEPLAIPDNDTDARKAVAVELTLTNGQHDICFSDGYPDKTRAAGPMTVAAEFAFYSRDTQGLRIASLAGGRLLRAAEVELRPAVRAYSGTVVAAHYEDKQIRLDQAWPALCGGGIFEIGSPGRTTSYTSADVRPDGAGCTLTLTRGADYFRGLASEVDSETGEVQTLLKPSLGRMAGLRDQFVASNERRTKFWRAKVLDEGAFKLTGGPVTAADFEPEGALRLWEYGVGDAVSQTTFAHLRRVEANVYVLSANVELTVAFAGARLEISPDNQTWNALPTAREGDKIVAALTLAHLGTTGDCYLRVTP